MDAIDSLVQDYMSRLKSSASRLPAAMREELVDEVRAHIELAIAVMDAPSDADVRNVFERLGDPDDIVDEALAEGAAPVTAAPQDPATQVTTSARDVVTWLLLTVGAIVLPIIGPLTGSLLALTAGWRRRQRLAVAALGLCLALLPPMALLGVRVSFHTGASSNELTAVDDVVGIRLDRALKLLEDQGFGVEYVPGAGESKKIIRRNSQFEVIKQTPGGGSALQRGETVMLTVGVPGAARPSCTALVPQAATTTSPGASQAFALFRNTKPVGRVKEFDVTWSDLDPHIWREDVAGKHAECLTLGGAVQVYVGHVPLNAIEAMVVRYSVLDVAGNRESREAVLGSVLGEWKVEADGLAGTLVP